MFIFELSAFNKNFVETFFELSHLNRLPGFYKEMYEITKSYGGVNIMDEVQTGFGRLGTHYWGFEYHGVKPDIITAAKSEFKLQTIPLKWHTRYSKSLR